MVTTFYPPFNFGGDGLYVHHLAHALARRGCEVEVVHDVDAWRVQRAGESRPARVADSPGVKVHRLESRWALGSTLLTQQLGRPVVHGAQLRRILSRDFDVIHYHNVSLVGGPGVLSMGSAIKFYTAHEHWLVCPTHVLWRHNRELCTGRECFRCTLAYQRPPQAWRATDFLERQSRHVDVFIALSRSSQDNHRAFGFDRPMTMMAPFLPELPAAAEPPAAGPPRTRPYFLFVGRLEAIKGLQDVIPHFDDGLDADLLIAGAGSHEAELRRLAAGRPQVQFLGHLPLDVLRSLYRGAVALVAPSICYEVFGLVLLEAFREGTPVIARALGAYPQTIAESGGGILFNDAGELRVALHRLLDDAGLRAELGERGRAAVQARWSEDAAMAAYFDLVRRTALARARHDVARKAERSAVFAAAPAGA